MKHGISHSVLVEQVRNTAAWLWLDVRCAPLTAVLDAAIDEPLESADAVIRAFRLRLASHYATVATFVPTDVDAHIRHHTWVAVADADVFARARACLEEAIARDATLVSARVTDGLSGHDGEWLSVRAGGLGRALVLGLDDQAVAIATEIDAELDREQRAFRGALDRGAPAKTVLALATTIAHNLGDLSRVVEAWPRSPRAPEFQARFSRLGHADGARHRADFLLAGMLNKDLMALENHRFLALRRPRALRRSRSLLLPIGPWFDTWGERIATSEHLEESDRAEVVEALVELHLCARRCRKAVCARSRGYTGPRAVASELTPWPCRRGCAKSSSVVASVNASTCRASASKRASRAASARSLGA